MSRLPGVFRLAFGRELFNTGRRLEIFAASSPDTVFHAQAITFPDPGGSAFGIQLDGRNGGVAT
jgi:hypothetical protein